MAGIALITTLVVLLGAAFMSAAILRAWKITGTVPPVLRSRWCMMIGFIFFFLIGYLLLVVILIARLSLPTELITGPIFLGGAVFVFIVISLTRDTINGMKTADEKLVASENYLRSIIETEPECVKLLSRDGTLLAMNPAGLEMIGAKTSDTVIGKSVYSLLTPEYKDAFRKFVESVCCGNKGTCEFEVIGLEGRRSMLESYAVPFYDERTKNVLMLSITRDVTERRKLEEQLCHATKMQAIGTLAGGIAHDFNNILTVIMGYGEILRDQVDRTDPRKNYVDQILAVSEKGSTLINSLLAFSRKQAINPRAVEANGIVRSAEQLILTFIGEDIELTTDLSDKPLTVLADAAQIEQVLINLVSNARDAMPEGGLLTIVTRPVEIEDEFIRVHGYGKAGAYALITVADTGVGMDTETRERIFEPFFTTKETGKGTGLGLSIVYGIIKQHSGYINVYSEPGKGSSFNVYLPLIRDRSEAEETKPPQEPAEGGRETILLAEDDTALRQLTKFVLEKYGYTVIEAIDGEDAVEKFMKNKDRIDLLLFDVVMPKKNGEEAFEEIRKVKADIRVIFSSGYPGDIVCKKVKIGENMELISKPVLPTVLMKKIREILAARTGRPPEPIK
jgi:two-component system, cell cycle sensor histidine kinase and response regulator CckA